MRLDQYLESPHFRNTMLQIARRKLEPHHPPPMEADDLAQIAVLEAWERRDQYDPARSSVKTFAHRYGVWAMQMALRDQTAQCRDYHGRVSSSLEAAMRRDENSGEGGAKPTVADYREALDRSMVLAEAMDLLSEEQRLLCARLENETPAEIAVADGVHRSTVYRQVGDIREVLARAGVSL